MKIGEKMKLTVLVDNNTLIDRYFFGEPGLSYYIEDNGEKILFDTGYSDVFIKNAFKMNIDLLDVDFLVLSHGHFDHTWGLDPLIKIHTEAVIEKKAQRKATLVAHPLIFSSRKYDDLEEVGSVITKNRLEGFFKIKLSKKPLWLTDNLVFLGEIPRKNDFEAKKPIGKTVFENVEKDDYILDDSALVYKSPKGLVVITGCSHSGICNIIEYAKETCGTEKIIDVIGGFHLLDPSHKQLQGTVEYLRAIQPQIVHACHCTDLNSKIALSKVVNLGETGVGMEFEF
jgi:7,8-dihydropterin-6-yl-methyl-4-(beta-D-ribofuranosyl)aminobenzene 5'-phosphate synthase